MARTKSIIQEKLNLALVCKFGFLEAFREGQKHTGERQENKDVGKRLVSLLRAPRAEGFSQAFLRAEPEGL